MNDDDLMSNDAQGLNNVAIQQNDGTVKDDTINNPPALDDNQRGKQDASQDPQQNDENDLIGKPESYINDNISLPEGMELNQDILKDFTAKAEKLNLSQKGYEQMVNYGIQIAEQTKNRMLENFKTLEEQKVLGYQREAFNDKEIGGDKLAQSVSEAALAYKEFATPAVQKLLSDTGLEFHPAVIKMFRTISQQMSDDKFQSGGIKQAEMTREQRMFPDMN